MLNLALPATVIEAIGSNFAQGWHRTRKDQSDTDRQRLSENIGRIPMPVAATIDSTLVAADLLQLAAGDVIALGRPVSDPVDVKVNGASKFGGRLTRLPHSAGIVVDIKAPAVPLEGAA